jgi:hypothetical protein
MGATLFLIWAPYRLGRQALDELAAKDSELMALKNPEIKRKICAEKLSSFWVTGKRILEELDASRLSETNATALIDDWMKGTTAWISKNVDKEAADFFLENNVPSRFPTFQFVPGREVIPTMSKLQQIRHKPSIRITNLREIIDRPAQ